MHCDLLLPLFEALGITRLSGVRNEIAAAAYDLSHEFNYWLDDFTEQVKPRLIFNLQILIKIKPLA